MSEDSCCQFCLPESSYKPEEYDFFGCLFPTACNFWIQGMDFCDEAPQNADCGCCGPRGRDCIVCYTCFTPIGLIIDMITLPFRGSYCICYKSKKICCKKNQVDELN